MSLLIKNGRIVTATDEFVGDVLVEGETVSAVGRLLSAAAADRVLDATADCW
jgi:dihydropyrimidinase